MFPFSAFRLYDDSYIHMCSFALFYFLSVTILDAENYFSSNYNRTDYSRKLSCVLLLVYECDIVPGELTTC